MEENLRKHILSEYTNTVGMEMVSNPTLNTATMEISDPDEFMLQSKGPTVMTEHVEMSDPDEFKISGPTLFTKSTEASDPDAFVMGNPTYFTHAVEESDPDEFRLSEELSNNSNILMAQIRHTYTVETSDEDEFLFMYDAKRGK